MDLNCPYCSAGLNVDHDDGFGYEEDELHEMECNNCEKNFVFRTTISFSYWPEKADCLNGEKHKYELTHTVPKEFSVMRCKDCGDTRELTNEERAKFKIDTKENYFKSIK